MLEYKPREANSVVDALNSQVELAVISQSKCSLVEWIKEGLSHDGQMNSLLELAQQGEIR